MAAGADDDNDMGGAVCESSTAHKEEPTGIDSFMQESPAAEVFRRSQYAKTQDCIDGVIPETQFSGEATKCPIGWADSPYDFLYENLEPSVMPNLPSSLDRNC